MVAEDVDRLTEDVYIFMFMFDVDVFFWGYQKSEVNFVSMLDFQWSIWTPRDKGIWEGRRWAQWCCTGSPRLCSSPWRGTRLPARSEEIFLEWVVASILNENKENKMTHRKHRGKSWQSWGQGWTHRGCRRAPCNRGSDRGWVFRCPALSIWWYIDCSSFKEGWGSLHC